jgi:FdhE protein
MRHKTGEMHGTRAGLRTDATAQLADLERRNPEWHAWLRLLREALRALDDAAWSDGLGDPSGAHAADAPLLHGRVLTVDSRRLGRLMQDLAATAAATGLAGTQSLARYRFSAEADMDLLAAVLRHDRSRLEGLGALETVMRLASLPLLQACRRSLQQQVPRPWPHGYCPICGSWPLLAELRSLDRSRWLRCGRCGGDWPVSWLCCAFCGESDHERLGTLVLEGEPETLTVETCSNCSGYLKAITTLQAIPPFELLLRDLDTVDLDVAALDRGFVRPEGDGVPLDLRVTERL